MKVTLKSRKEDLLESAQENKEFSIEQCQKAIYSHRAGKLLEAAKLYTVAEYYYNIYKRLLDSANEGIHCRSKCNHISGYIHLERKIRYFESIGKEDELNLEIDNILKGLKEILLKCR